MNIDELPLLSIEPFENHGEVPIITRAELEPKNAPYLSYSVNRLVYVAGLFSFPEFPDQKYLICSERVRRYMDGTATIPVDLAGFLRHEYHLVSTIARFTPFEISGEPIVVLPHWERLDWTKDYCPE